MTKIEEEILRAVKDVKFGSIEIVIHNSQIVQIERKTKIRFDKSSDENENDNET